MHNGRISQIRIKSDCCQKKCRYVHSMHTYVSQRMCRVKLVAIDSPQYSLTFSDVNVLLMLCHLVVNFVELLFLTFTEEFSTIWPWPKMNAIFNVPSTIQMFLDYATIGSGGKKFGLWDLPNVNFGLLISLVRYLGYFCPKRHTRVQDTLASETH